MDDPIEDLFRHRLQHHEEQPPANAWPRIKEEITPGSRKRPVFGWRWFSVLLLGLATAVLTLRVLTASLHNAPLAASTTQADSSIAGLPETDQKATHPNPQNAARPHAPGSEQARTDVAPAQGSNPSGAPAGAAAPGQKAAGTSGPTVNALPPAPAQHPAPTATRPTQLPAVAINPNTAAEQLPGKEKNRDKPAAAGSHLPGFTVGGNSPNLIARPIRTPRPPHQPTAPVPEPIAKDAETADRLAQPGKPTETPGADKPVEIAAAASLNQNVSDPQFPLATPADSTAAEPAQKPELAAADEALRLAVTPDSAALPHQADKKLTFGFYTGARYSFRRFAPNSSDQLYISNLTDKNDNNPTRLNFEVGAAAQLQLSKNLAAEAAFGALYTTEKVEYMATTGQTASPTLTQAGNYLQVQPNYRFDKHTAESKAVYSNLRTGLVYTMRQTPLASLQLSGGSQVSLLSWNESEAFVNGTRTAENTPELSRVQAGAYAGVRLKRSISKGLDLAVEPSASYYVNSRYQKASPFSVRNHTYNLNLLFFLK